MSLVVKKRTNKEGEKAVIIRQGGPSSSRKEKGVLRLHGPTQDHVGRGRGTPSSPIRGRRFGDAGRGDYSLQARGEKGGMKALDDERILVFPMNRGKREGRASVQAKVLRNCATEEQRSGKKGEGLGPLGEMFFRGKEKASAVRPLGERV